MRNILAFLLCLALLAGSGATAFAANFADVENGEYYSEAVFSLAERGWIGGYEDGTFRPTAPITRAEFAVILVNVLGLDTEGPFEKTFRDVPKTHWSYKFVSAAADAGFISGYPDGKFQPERNVSYNEAITMIVASKGYTFEELGGVYPTSFTNKARDLGILNTCAILSDDPATRANIACLVCDSVKSDNGQDCFHYATGDYRVFIERTGFYEEIDTENLYMDMVLTVENDSAYTFHLSPAEFALYVDGKLTPVSEEGYEMMGLLKPATYAAPGKTMRIHLVYLMPKDYTAFTLQMDLINTGTGKADGEPKAEYAR